MEIKIRVRREYSFTSTGLSPIAELPPHARRIHQESDWQEARLGTTSACAENTAAFGSAKIPPRNYLRVRGEYRLGVGCAPNPMELPPHARRIRVAGLNTTAENGTTSACAENTTSSRAYTADYRNYLRMRGEYWSPNDQGSPPVELPPHARRIPADGGCWFGRGGTTSACAENTRPELGKQRSSWNYLRVRGEYSTRISFSPRSRELPPRARRRLIQQRIRVVHGGTTSACAENTQLCSKLFESRWNYLRVRGEYISLDTTARSHKELPPRARRILHGKSMISTSVGTTSACAENTQLILRKP